MSTLFVTFCMMLASQVAGDRYSGNVVGNPFAVGGNATTSAPSGNGSTSGAGTPASGAAPPPASSLPGPPERLESTYNVGGNRSLDTSSPSGQTGGLGSSYSVAGSQPPPDLSPRGGGSAYAPIGGGAMSPEREVVSPSNTSSSVASNSVLKPTGMMRAMMAPHASSRLSGEWVSLDEIVSAASPRGDQSKQVEAYWDLCSSVADYFLGLREQEEIRRLRGLFPNAGAALQRAEQELAVRVGTAERAARASQWRLASLSGRGGDRLPLPADQPFCGTYETRYEQVFTGRPSSEAAELNELISLRQAELQDACDAVNRTDALLRQMSARPGSLSDESVLQALELIALERRAFVQISRDYNRRIARYVELARPGQIAPEQLIGMLIRRSPSATATRPATALPGDRRSQTGPEGQQTFASGADGWSPAEAEFLSAAAINHTPPQRDDFVAPVSAETPPIEFGERSLLVQPR